MHFLVIDSRFGTPIHVFLERDPRGEDDFPGLAVQAVTLESPVASGEETLWRSGVGSASASAVGRNPWRSDRFREFESDRAVAGAGFVLIEPRYVGPSWWSYLSTFRPEGGKPPKRPRPPLAAPRAER
jgi:hypothetical protein